MKSILFAAALALALPAGAVLAHAEDAIGNYTTTSMGAPLDSPNFESPRSAAVPGLAPEVYAAQQRNLERERASEFARGEVNLAPQVPGTQG